MIELYYWPTPNGHKITIFLEETGLPYRIRPINIGAGDQFKPDFLKISPNNRMPAIIDHAPADGGAPISVFESGAILEYLAEKTGKFLPAEPREKFAVLAMAVLADGRARADGRPEPPFRTITRPRRFPTPSTATSRRPTGSMACSIGSLRQDRRLHRRRIIRSPTWPPIPGSSRGSAGPEPRRFPASAALVRDDPRPPGGGARL